MPTTAAELPIPLPPARANVTAASDDSPANPDAVSCARAYLERNGTARMALAYYYQEFILDLPAPRAVPMVDVAVALGLSGDGAISDYKKQLRRFIRHELGHQRELAEFLLANELLTTEDLALARKVALANERSGKCEMTQRR